MSHDTIAVLKNVLFFSDETDPECEVVLKRYYIDGKSVHSILREGISGWKLEKYIDVKKQLFLTLSSLFSGQFDPCLVNDSENVSKLVKRLFSLFGYVEEFKSFRKNKKVLNLIESFILLKIPFRHFIVFSGFIFFNSSIPVTVTDLSTLKEYGTLNESVEDFIIKYTTLIKMWKHTALIKTAECVSYGEYFTIKNYHTFKNCALPFIFYIAYLNKIKFGPSDSITQDHAIIAHDLMFGIKIKMVSSSFKSKNFRKNNTTNNIVISKNAEPATKAKSGGRNIDEYLKMKFDEIRSKNGTDWFTDESVNELTDSFLSGIASDEIIVHINELKLNKKKVTSVKSLPKKRFVVSDSGVVENTPNSTTVISTSSEKSEEINHV